MCYQTVAILQLSIIIAFSASTMLTTMYLVVDTAHGQNDRQSGSGMPRTYLSTLQKSHGQCQKRRRVCNSQHRGPFNYGKETAFQKIQISHWLCGPSQVVHLQAYSKHQAWIALSFPPSKNDAQEQAQSEVHGECYPGQRSHSQPQKFPWIRTWQKKILDAASSQLTWASQKRRER